MAHQTGLYHQFCHISVTFWADERHVKQENCMDKIIEDDQLVHITQQAQQRGICSSATDHAQYYCLLSLY